MEQQIGFCKTSDGVGIAYATLGDGPPLAYVCGWPVHLELEWEKPFARAFLEALAEGCRLIRYDMRGSGLSDRDITEFSLETLSRDLEAVVDQLKLERFALISLGVLGGPVAIAYAAANPQRVSKLVLNSAFVEGAKLISPERGQALIEYVDKFGFPLRDFISLPNVDMGAERDVRQIQDAAASPKVQAALLRLLYSADVSQWLDRLTMPVLVMHGHADRSVPFSRGRDLAARLPAAKFVAFEGNSAAAWSESRVIIPEIHSFLGIALPPPSAPRAASQGLAIILFTDVEGSTALTERLGDEAARELLRAHEEIVRHQLQRHGGVEVKTMGDGFMTSFSSASSALECAIELQRALAAKSREHADTALRMRVGLNAGEPIAEGDDLFGTAVNLAARIAAEAGAGEILASDVVRQLAAGKGFLFVDRGEAALRGFEEPVRLYEVGWQA